MTDSSAKLPNLWLLIAAAASILLITIGMRMTLGLFVLPVVNSTELSMNPVQPDYCRFPIDVGHIATLVRRVSRPLRRV